MSSSKQQLTVKVQSQTKTKRLRDVPSSFKALTDIIEQQIREERDLQAPANGDQSFRSTSTTFASGRDFVIRYIDNEDETINVSDDEDLLTAYDIAERDLKGSLKLTVQFKSQLQRSVPATTPMPFTPREESKREEVPTATSNEAARLLSKQALKKAMKEAQREAAKREKMEAKKA